MKTTPKKCSGCYYITQLPTTLCPPGQEVHSDIRSQWHMQKSERQLAGLCGLELTMLTTKAIAMSRLATAATLTEALMRKAIERAVVLVRVTVR